MTLNQAYPRFKWKLPMLLDGSTGTALMKAGMPAGSSTERWVLENPEKLTAIQDGYREAGSDAVYTPTFGANRPTLERAFEGEEMPDVHELNVKLARLSTGKKGLAGGDMSPTGCFIEPYGDTPFEAVVDAYREQAKALDEAGVDFFVSETNISLAEARAAVIAVKEVSDKPIFVTVTVDEDGRTLSGDSLLCCLLALSELGVAAFGTNCSHGPDKMLELLRELVPYSRALGVPLIAKPNAGLPHEENGERRFDLTAEEFASCAPKLLEAGVAILGGCCGTEHTYIKLLRGELDAFSGEASEVERVDVSSLVCTNREVFELPPDAPTIEVGENFFDVACEKSEPFIAHLADEAAAERFLEAAPMLAVGCALSGDEAAVAKASRLYVGRAPIRRA